MSVWRIFLGERERRKERNKEEQNAIEYLRPHYGLSHTIQGRIADKCVNSGPGQPKLHAVVCRDTETKWLCLWKFSWIFWNTHLLKVTVPPRNLDRVDTLLKRKKKTQVLGLPSSVFVDFLGVFLTIGALMRRWDMYACLTTPVGGAPKNAKRESLMW